MRYRAKYKCRYCGESFLGPETSSEDIVISLLTELSLGEAATSAKYGVPVCMVSAHFANDYDENPHYGIGDLIGFEVKNNETDN